MRGCKKFGQNSDKSIKVLIVDLRCAKNVFKRARSLNEFIEGKQTCLS
ncbi:hypothetical protein C1O63_0062 [Dehalococcoides mccartyi]|nr:hypothetical protein C1O63_0062 [Dehalococcoides mccartyi]